MADTEGAWINGALDGWNQAVDVFDPAGTHGTYANYSTLLNLVRDELAHRDYGHAYCALNRTDVAHVDDLARGLVAAIHEYLHENWTLLAAPAKPEAEEATT